MCGRIVADALFSPEYLADKHILGEGQISSRTRLETLPPEMTELFYGKIQFYVNYINVLKILFANWEFRELLTKTKNIGFIWLEMA